MIFSLSYLQGAYRTLVICFILLAVSGCQQFGSKKPVAKAPEKVTQTTNAIPTAGDKIAAFAMKAKFAERKQIVLDSGLRVTTEAGRKYTSALGVPCRRVNIINGQSEVQVSAVCLKNNVWRTMIRP